MWKKRGAQSFSVWSTKENQVYSPQRIKGVRSSKPFDLKFVRRQDFDFPVVQKSLSFTLINEFSAVFELVISEFLVHAFIFIL